MSAIRFLVFAGLLSLVCAACRPPTPGKAENKPAVPDLPEVADAGLRQQLFTLRAMVVEYTKLSDPSTTRDEKTANRLALLRQGVNELESKCRADLGATAGGGDAVKDFLDRCSSLVSN